MKRFVLVVLWASCAVSGHGIEITMGNGSGFYGYTNAMCLLHLATLGGGSDQIVLYPGQTYEADGVYVSTVGSQTAPEVLFQKPSGTWAGTFPSIANEDGSPLTGLLMDDGASNWKMDIGPFYITVFQTWSYPRVYVDGLCYGLCTALVVATVYLIKKGFTVFY